MTIPKILHQVWIGPLDPPQEALDTWRDMHPGWDYRLHREHTGYPEELQTVLRAIDRANRPDKWRAMTDCIRWWLLYTYGGIATDADSECIRPLDEWLLKIPEWAAWEHEEECPGVIANGTVAAEPGSLLMSRLLQRLPLRLPDGAPWLEFGPHYLTGEAYGYRGLTVLPSRHFIPWHAGLSHPYGKAAPGDHVVYARQFWGSRVGYQGLDVSDPKLVILSTGVKIPEFAPMCLGSVQRQAGRAVRQIVYTDRETARICRDVARTYERGCLVDIREDKGSALANIWEAMHDPAMRGKKVVFVDLDDMLLEGAMNTLRDVLDGNPNLRIGWGQFRMWPTGGKGFSAPLPPGVTLRRSYREAPWVTSHLRWCDADLFCELDASELKRSDGAWLPFAGDCAMWWSMLERTYPWEQQFIRRELYAYNRRFVDGLTEDSPELAETKACEAEVRAKPRAKLPPMRTPKPEKVRLNVGCGKLPRDGWVNLDCVAGDGVDIVCDLETGCIPLPDNSVDEIHGDHVLEHIGDQLHALEELWRVARPGAYATFVVPHADSVLAREDPTHKHFMSEGSWRYFSQAHYTFADYGYRGNWVVHTLQVAQPLMVAVLRCVKPAVRA